MPEKSPSKARQTRRASLQCSTGGFGWVHVCAVNNPPMPANQRASMQLSCRPAGVCVLDAPPPSETSIAQDTCSCKWAALATLRARMVCPCHTANQSVPHPRSHPCLSPPRLTGPLIHELPDHEEHMHQDLIFSPSQPDSVEEPEGEGLGSKRFHQTRQKYWS